MGIYPDISIIQPTQIKIADYYNAAATNDSYATLVDTVTGRGMVTRLTAFSTSSYDNTDLTFKLTLDGVEQTITGSQASAITRGIEHSGAGGCGGEKILFWIGQIYFYQSLKIEVKQTTGDTRALIASADYSTE